LTLVAINLINALSIDTRLRGTLVDIDIARGSRVSVVAVALKVAVECVDAAAVDTRVRITGIDHSRAIVVRVSRIANTEVSSRYRGTRSMVANSGQTMIDHVSTVDPGIVGCTLALPSIFEVLTAATVETRT